MKLLGTPITIGEALNIGVMSAFLNNSHRYRLAIEVGTPDEGRQIGWSIIQVIRSQTTLGYGRIYGDVLPSSIRLVARSAFKAAVVVVMLFAGAATAAGQSFNPIRKLTTWYTDRSLVDIQITGSTSTVPDLHRLEPGRVLRFRLERAYVHHLSAQRGPGFESVNFGIDIETQLPDSLMLAGNQPGQFREEIPDVPKLSLQEWGRRRLLIRLRSARSAASLNRVSDGLEACKGTAQDGQLLTYVWEGRDNCGPPDHRNGSRHIARYDSGLLLKIDCQDAMFPGLACTLRFPFEEFAVELAFHYSQLPKWREVVERAGSFLNSKEYR